MKTAGVKKPGSVMSPVIVPMLCVGMPTGALRARLTLTAS
jgi:hypothetical protein